MNGKLLKEDILPLFFQLTEIECDACVMTIEEDIEKHGKFGQGYLMAIKTCRDILSGKTSQGQKMKMRDPYTITPRNLRRLEKRNKQIEYYCSSAECKNDCGRHKDSLLKIWPTPASSKGILFIEKDFCDEHGKLKEEELNE